MTDPMNPEELRACRERAEAATPGPWSRLPIPCCDSRAVVGRENGRVERVATVGSWDRFDANAAFIAEARADVPRLLATIAARDARLEAVADVLSAHGCDCECGCDSDGHDDDCEPCLGCRIEAAMKGASR